MKRAGETVILRCRRATAASKGGTLMCGHPSRRAQERVPQDDGGNGGDDGGEGEFAGSGGGGVSGRGGSRQAPALRPAIIQ